MRLLLSSSHRYPASSEVGSGPHPKAFPSGSGFVIHDLLAKGLAELGHEVFYLLRGGADKKLPVGVVLVSKPQRDADVLHTIAYRDEENIRERYWRGRPWVTTCHLDVRARGRKRAPTTENWIFVSQTLARSHGRNRFVLNGVD